MAEKVFIVKHMFDVDGGFGDAIPSEEIVGIFLNRQEAEEIVQKYGLGDGEVYGKPYNYLCCGELRVEEVPIGLSMEVDDMWWFDRVKEYNEFKKRISRD